MFVDVGHAQYLNGNLRPTNFSCIFGKGAIQLTSTSIPMGLVEKHQLVDIKVTACYT